MSERGQIVAAAELFTHDQAATYLHICPKTLRSLRQRGLIRYVAITARKILYRPEDCDAYLESCATVGEYRPTNRRKPPKLRAEGNVLSFTARRQQRTAARGR